MKQQIDESIVFTGTRWSSLRYGRITNGTFSLRNDISNKELSASTVYTEKIDYIVDTELGRIKRTSNSRIADFANNVLYGQDKFDHKLHGTYGNKEFTVYATYEYDEKSQLSDKRATRVSDGKRGLGFSSKLMSKLMDGDKIDYVVFGDSISTGAEANEENKYFNRFVNYLRSMYPQANIEIHMKAIGGETSKEGLKRINEVVSIKPDLVTIGYGMNDQSLNKDNENYVKLEEYEENISSMIDQTLKSTFADIILVTPCLSNPKSKYSSSNFEEYTIALHRVAEKYKLAVADVQRLWLQELKAGKSHESLLLNNINHPNDYGHYIYFKAFVDLFGETE